MSAKHALLGLLLDRSAYPYELANRLQHRLGPAWEINSGQLYQLVKRLEEDGLIARVEDVPHDREDRHVFAITDEGVVEFERWFDQSAGAVRLCRRPLLVKVTFAGPQRLREALAQVDAYELQCAERLNEIARLREGLPGDGPLVRADHLLLRLNLSADIFQLEGELRWARHAREMLSWLANRETVWSGPGGSDGLGGSNAAEERRDRGDARRQLFDRIAAEEPAEAEGAASDDPARGG